MPTLKIENAEFGIETFEIENHTKLLEILEEYYGAKSGLEGLIPYKDKDGSNHQVTVPELADILEKTGSFNIWNDCFDSDFLTLAK